MRFNEQDLELLETLINCLIFPVRNALLYRDAVQSALSDSLTGAGNRLALENTLEREIALSFRNELPLSILVVDIDMFKSINDRFGHSAGDCVLKNVVKLLGQDCRETDSTYRAYRFGGEEFVLILNNTDRAGATIVAERIRQHIEITSTSYQQQDIQATVSVGVSTLREGDNLSTLFSRADKALYQAKHNGRNQVVDWQEMAT
jgi:diguanylate cyclase (GGDEF)-like protein